MNATEVFLSLVDSLAHDEKKKTYMDRSKVSAMLAVWSATTMVMWLYVMFCRLTFGLHIVTYGGLLSTIIHSLAPVFFHYTRSIPITGMVISFTGLIFQFLFCLYSGGMESPAAIWFALHPVLLAFFASITVIGVSVLVNAIIVGTLTYLKFNSLLPLNVFPAVYQEIMSVSSYIGLDVLIAIFTVATMKLNLKASGIIRAKKDMIENLVRILSHDICNPLTVASAQTYRLRKKEAPFDKEITRLEKSHEQILQIVESVRYWMAAQGNKMILKKESLSFVKIVDHLDFTFSDRFLAKKIEFVCETEVDNSVTAKGDRNAILFQVFNNIISNAIKFTPEGKRISLKASQEGSRITYRILDSGAGIPDELREKVFSNDAATTSKGTNNEAGTGFGMPIVKTLMEKMNATVDISNAIENGEVIGAEVTLVFDIYTAEDQSQLVATTGA